MFIDLILDSAWNGRATKGAANKLAFKDQARGGGAAGIKPTPGGIAAFKA